MRRIRFDFWGAVFESAFRVQMLAKRMRHEGLYRLSRRVCFRACEGMGSNTDWGEGEDCSDGTGDVPF